jgi:hypothetical protein
LLNKEGPARPTNQQPCKIGNFCSGKQFSFELALFKFNSWIGFFLFLHVTCRTQRMEILSYVVLQIALGKYYMHKVFDLRVFDRECLVNPGLMALQDFHIATSFLQECQI